MSRRWDSDERRRERAQLLEQYPELGFFDDTHFDPRNWHPILDNPAFVRQTARDRYWGAKRVAQFSAREIQTVIALGHYEPATAARLFKVLWQRRAAIARAYFTESSALDYFRFVDGQLCFDDLWIAAGLDETGRYFQVMSKKHERRELGAARCLSVPLDRSYHIVELGSWRGKHPPTVRVHYMGTGSGAYLIGIER